ncbi:MAG: type II secretion system F family protein [Oligoflexia bacterium]|nr:type II secretion system F family protein [Oligoflexia bacterium]
MLTMKLVGYLILAGAVFGISYQYNKKFLDWLRFQSLGTRDYIVEKLSQMFIDIPPQRILLGLFALSFGLGTLVFLAFLPRLFPGIPFAIMTAIAGWKAPKPIVDMIYRRRVKTFTLQMVDALGLMSNGLKSGLSIVQSLGLVTQEMPNPIQQEFNLILSQNKLGVPLEEAFTNLSKRVQSDDVEMFVTSVNILKETGGNLAETFDTIVTTIRERIKVENKISAMTTQGFYQGIFVMAIPPLLGAFFYQSDPEFMRPLFTTAIGWAIVMVIILLEAIGFFVIMKVIKIDV